MKRIVIIPARLESSRLCRKLLLPVKGKPIIQRTFEQAALSSADEVYVATDSKDIAKVIGDRALITGDWPTGTDRVAAASLELPIDDDTLIVNVQGDEPEILPSHIDSVFDMLDQGGEKVQVATCVSTVNQEQLTSDSVVKAIVKVTRQQDRSWIFSAHLSGAIAANEGGFAVCKTFTRDFKTVGDWALAGYQIRRHVGIYGYRPPFLRKFREMPQTPQELQESLEQFRMLAITGMIVGDVVCGEIDGARQGIDTYDDYRKYLDRI